MWMTYCEWYSWYYRLLESFMNEVEHVIYGDRSIRLNNIESEYFPRLDSEEVQNRQVKKEVLTYISRRSIELISVQEQWLNERKRMFYISYASVIGSVI